MFTPNKKPEGYALNVHFNGLSHLYSFVKGEEEMKLKEDPTLAQALFVDFGSSDRGDIILNHFIWYSNSFLPFIDLFTRAYKPQEDDLRREFRAVKTWRHKVAAHFSLVKPNSDSAMVQTASVNQFVTWSNGRFSVGREVYSNADTGDSTPDNWGWELTEVHERVLAILKRFT
jgi:hypothetical protein